MKSKFTVGQRVKIKVWHEAANHWDCDWEETIEGTIVALPIPTYSNNWNYNPSEFDIKKTDGKVVHIKSNKVTVL